MKPNLTSKIVKMAACVLLVTGLGTATALASCGDSFTAIAARAKGVASTAGASVASNPAGDGSSNNRTVVGMWYVQFLIGGQVIQEAYQIWNTGGTEVHNPNVDPRTSNICLGAWDQDKPSGKYKLAHRVWSYDGNGTFLGTIHLSETVLVGPAGKTHWGSFTLDFYDPSGNFQNEVKGQVSAQRISPN